MQNINKLTKKSISITFFYITTERVLKCANIQYLERRGRLKNHLKDKKGLNNFVQSKSSEVNQMLTLPVTLGKWAWSEIMHQLSK